MAPTTEMALVATEEVEIYQTECILEWPSPSLFVEVTTKLQVLLKVSLSCKVNDTNFEVATAELRF